MAVDTRDKRASVIGLNLVMRLLPNPSGTVGAPARLLVARTYAGIAAGAPGGGPTAWPFLYYAQQQRMMACS